jgi:hypothetical protein
MKWSVIIVGAVFAVALAVVIGSRMSADAMAVLVGVACGIGASVPTCLLLVWALVRRAQGMAAGAQGYGRSGAGANYPPVVVVNPGYGAQSYGPALGMISPPPGQLAGANGPLAGGPRTFKVVGDEETLEDSISGALFG